MKILKIGVGVLLSSLMSLTLMGQNLKKANNYVQVFEVKSNNCELDGDKYVFENDSVKITYYFWGDKGIMQIGIKNKLDVPLYFNWQESYYKNINHKLSYAPEIEMNEDNYEMYNKYMHGGRSLTAMDYSLDYQTATSTEFKTKVEIITEIKPNGYYMRLKYNILADKIYSFDETARKINQVHNENSKKTSDIYEITFDESNTPFKFESNLVYSTQTDFKDKSQIKHNFWVSKAQEIEGKHFRGVRIGKNPDGYNNYKFPFKQSTSFYYEIDKKEAFGNKK